MGQLMGRARSSMIARLDAQLLPFGLSSMHFMALKNLQRGGARTAAELCRSLGYDTGAMTRILDRLEARGLLRRERSRADRRRVLLHLAPAGRRLLPRLSAAGERIMDMHLGGFQPAEIATLKNYLSRMIANGTGRGDNPPDHPDTSS
ncbi:MAG: MarR family transcriptional regulator [Proteobacteria bacterium]|nr:MarR family transcriptional regulator [Pseudomonadota bacterium]